MKVGINGMGRMGRLALRAAFGAIDRQLTFSSHATAGEIPWADWGVDVVLKCTSKFLTPDTLQGRLDRGAKRVRVAAPVKVGNGLNILRRQPD